MSNILDFKNTVSNALHM